MEPWLSESAQDFVFFRGSSGIGVLALVVLLGRM